MKNMGTILGLHHYAYRCRDAEETRRFYEDLLGLPLVMTMKLDRVPSTGEACPYVHIFFEMADGACIGFFDLGDNSKPLPSPNTPPWVNHIALKMKTVDDVLAAKVRLEAAGVSVLGVTDHGFVQSIYFFDPNGIRLELTAESSTPEEMARFKAEARGLLDAWTREKAGRLQEAASA
jgi:catechol 2,3-dioxygenase-like lactoylglutathione lyase family enzyme